VLGVIAADAKSNEITAVMRIPTPTAALRLALLD